jgi:signal transduction histidine kinase
MPPRTRGGADGYSDVTVVVTDQGCGISPENQEKLFRNFVQIRPSTLQKGQGSGLGLALCKAIVDLHEGSKIGVRSEEGRGSSFYFTIRFPVDAPRVGGGGGAAYAPNTATATTASLLRAAPSGYGTGR